MKILLIIFTSLIILVLTSPWLAELLLFLYQKSQIEIVYLAYVVFKAISVFPQIVDMIPY